jgi:hypothetical protein
MPSNCPFASRRGAGEIASQVSLTRPRSGGTGHVLYNATSTITRNGGAVATSLSELYRTRALPPSYPWLDATPPPAPGITVAGSLLTIVPTAGEQARWWSVRAHSANGWTTTIVFGTERSVPAAAGTDRVIVNAVDAAGNVSVDVEWRR